MSSYSAYFTDDGVGNYTVVVENAPATLPAGGTFLSIPWITNANAGNASIVISSATTATPIACTAASAHGLVTGDTVYVSGGLVLNINGTYNVTVTSSTVFSLDKSVGSGTYTASSASFKKLTKAKNVGEAIQAAQRAIMDDRASGN